MKRIAIIGAGISGLTCALRLEELRKQHRADMEVSVYEAAPRAGGAIETETRDGFTLEKGPDSFISEKPSVLDLCQRLGIDSEVLDTQENNRKAFVIKNGRPIRLPDGFYLIAPTRLASLAFSPLFSPLGKIRIASEFFIPRKKTDTDESIASFVRRRFGQEALERVGQPMIAGVYSGDPEQLSLSSTMPKFRDLESRHGSVIRGLLRNAKEHHLTKKVSGPRYGLFLSFTGGMETLVSACVTRLPKENIHLGSRIKIRSGDMPGKWVVTDLQGREKSFDAICLSVSAKGASAILKDVDPSIAGKLGELHYESVATLNIAYKRTQIAHALDSFGLVVPVVEKRSLMACTFTSQKYKGRAPEGTVLLRAFVGGAFGKKFFDMDDAELQKHVSLDLKEFLGISGEPLFCSLSRYPGSLPQYSVGHTEWVAGVDHALQGHAGIFLTGASYRGTGISSCVLDAERQAEAIRRYFYP